MTGARPRQRGAVGYREARAHALIAAVGLWIWAIGGTLAGDGYRNLAGQLVGGDFIQLYTLGHVAFDGAYPALDAADALHARQVELLPASDPEFYFPVYPPQAALVFAPLARLPYAVALGIWTFLLVLAYAGIVWRTWQSVRDVLPDPVFVAAAAAAFPPFVNLVLFGQTTLFPLLGFFLGWLALERGRPIYAGAALTLLAIKPQFGLALGAVVILTGQWRILAGALLGFAVQASAVIVLMGEKTIATYAGNVLGFARIEPLLEPKPWQMHSLRSLTNLVPEIGTILFLLLAAGVVLVAAAVWRSTAPLPAKFSVLVMGSVLVNPHLFVYDAAVLALPLLWLGGWMERDRLEFRRAYWLSVYALFVLFLIPTARFVYVQLSVVVLVWLFWRVAQIARSDRITVAAV